MFTAKAELEYHNSWLIAKCDQELLEYYRWWFWRKTHLWLMKPRWGAHISVVRGSEEEQPVERIYEHQRENLKITFHYSNELIHQPYGYVWMPVWGKDIEDVREECGVPRSPMMPFHMTVGRSDLL